jgi:CBS domain-containing protein
MKMSDVYEKRVKDVMSRDLVTIDAKDSVHEALQLMAENKVAALPVVDRQGRCVGIISTSDLVDVTRDLEAGLDELEKADQLLWGQYLAKIGNGVGHQHVMDLMSEGVVSTRPDAFLSDAGSRMLRERVHRLPVVDESQRLLGILSTTDILTALVECAPIEAK